MSWPPTEVTGSGDSRFGRRMRVPVMVIASPLVGAVPDSTACSEEHAGSAAFAGRLQSGAGWPGVGDAGCAKAGVANAAVSAIVDAVADKRSAVNFIFGIPSDTRNAGGPLQVFESQATQGVRGPAKC